MAPALVPTYLEAMAVTSTTPNNRLAAAYYDEGYENDAEVVLMAKERHRLRSRAAGRPVTAPAVSLWSWLQRSVVGYGYRPMRALTWLIMVMLVGTIWFALHTRAIEVNKDDHVIWNPLLLAMDLALPIVDLGQDGRWHFDGPSLWVASGLSVFGWLMLGAILACLPRTLRRR